MFSLTFNRSIASTARLAKNAFSLLKIFELRVVEAMSIKFLRKATGSALLFLAMVSRAARAAIPAARNPSEEERVRIHQITLESFLSRMN
jgi:hypothetical protein